MENKVTPELARELTGCTFTEEYLKSKNLAFVIWLLDIRTRRIKDLETNIGLLEERYFICEPKAKHKAQSTIINRRSKPESSRSFLRVVS